MMPREVVLFAALRIGMPPADVHDILGNERRRELIRELAATTDTDHRGEIVLEVGELAERIAATEADVPRDQITPEDRQRVYVGILQTHAPVLDSYGVVTYHSRAQKIEAKEPVVPLAGIIGAIDSVCISADGAGEQIDGGVR